MGKINDEMKANQWKKGVSGNPKGRPKEAWSMTTILKNKLVMIDPKDKNKRTWMEEIVDKTIQQAIKGDNKCIREIFERVDGKVAQPIGLDVAMKTEEAVNTLQAIFQTAITIDNMDELEMLSKIIEMQKKKRANNKGKKNKKNNNKGNRK